MQIERINNPDILIILKNPSEPTLILPTEDKEDDTGVDFAPLFEDGAELGGFEAWG